MGWGRGLVILAAPLLLASCLLTPGRFTSSLDIRADRSFTFAYQGEAVLDDSAAQSTGGAGEDKPEKPTPKAETQDDLLKKRAVAEALSREVGYRSVEYLGHNKFRIDYSFTGRLDRSYVFPPFNADGASIVPWLAIEVRKDDTARMQAPGFGDQSSSLSMPMAIPGGTESKPSVDRQGVFTFSTDAQLVMQNNEAGTAPGPGTRVIWTVTPTSKAVPTAVVRFAN